MKINFKNKAFTITEALVSFALIGLIFVATVTNIGRNDHYDKLYWQAFNTLYQASKSASTDFENKNSYKEKWRTNYDGSGKNGNNSFDRGGNRNDATPHIQRKYPGFLKNDPLWLNDIGGDTFCKKLTEYINTSQTQEECKNLILEPNFTILSTRGKIGVNFYKGFSSVKKGEGGTYDVTTNVIEPSFTTLNGQKFYISQILTANFVFDNKNEAFNFKERESFRFVVVDLNGNSGPNTQFAKKGRYPDVVLFAIDSEGNVIPLGLPEFTKTYIRAVATYPTDVRSDGSPVYPAVRSSVGILWNIKKRAWGYSAEDSTSAEGKFPYMQPISQFEALSQSTKFYYNAFTCIKNPENCEKKTMSKNKSYVDSAYTYLVYQFLLKEEGSEKTLDGITETEFVSAKNSLDKDNGCITINNINSAPSCGIDFKH